MYIFSRSLKQISTLKYVKDAIGILGSLSYMSKKTNKQKKTSKNKPWKICKLLKLWKPVWKTEDQPGVPVVCLRLSVIFGHNIWFYYLLTDTTLLLQTLQAT